MNKLVIKLSASDVRVLTAVLEYILTSEDVAKLKQAQQVDYLLFACMTELFARLDLKRREIMQYGLPVKKHGVTPTVKVTIKRHEAIAFFLLVRGQQTESLLPAVPNETAQLLNSIVNDIHRTFFV